MNSIEYTNKKKHGMITSFSEFIEKFGQNFNPEEQAKRIVSKLNDIELENRLFIRRVGEECSKVHPEL